MDIFASTLDIIGKVSIAYTAPAVHRRGWREYKIDKKVRIPNTYPRPISNGIYANA